MMVNDQGHPSDILHSRRILFCQYVVQKIPQNKWMDDNMEILKKLKMLILWSSHPYDLSRSNDFKGL